MKESKIEVSSRIILDVKDHILDLSEIEALLLFEKLKEALKIQDPQRIVNVPFQNPIRDYNTPVICKDFKITTSPSTGDDPNPPWYSICGDCVK